MQLLSLGAIHKQTREYVYPKIANKKEQYICPQCHKDLILCQGQIKAHHFRHKVDHVNPCHHYSHPSESEIHKDAKHLLKQLLERKIPITFQRECCSCNKKEEYEIPEMTETSTISLEYRFEFNGGTKIADVAYLEDNEILCIFEICNTHKTCSENRPEPWFEIDAKTLIQLANETSLHLLQIPCIRSEKCEDCVNIELSNAKNTTLIFSTLVDELVDKLKPDKYYRLNHYEVCYFVVERLTLEQHKKYDIKKVVLAVVCKMNLMNFFDTEKDMKELALTINNNIKACATHNLMTWISLSDGDIPPFEFRDFDGIWECDDYNNYVLDCDYGDYNPDIIANDKGNNAYFIDLTLKNYSTLLKQQFYQRCVSVYYIDINWILQQKTQPEQIEQCKII